MRQSHQQPIAETARAEPPTLADLTQAIVELKAASIGHRAYAAQAHVLGATAEERAEELALAERCERVIDWLRIQYQ